MHGSTISVVCAFASSVWLIFTKHSPILFSDPSPEEARRAKCEALKDQCNAAAHAPRAYRSPGAATQNAQGRAVPKIERDKSRRSLEDAYLANCK
ncbi:hypothetical protein [Cupriavidus lacunae]|uniref:hypothetical protein n=1 Tax=Cupriavidus lacunae TaxID=2666307 RepID=UPI001374CA67